MFGFSFGEIVILIIVAIVLIGPRQLPSMLRTAGQWVTKLRRMAFDMRAQSGIDQLLRDEGLEKDIKELRQLLALRRGNVIDALTVDLTADPDASPKPAKAAQRAKGASSRDDVVTLLTEYPAQGADAYGAVPEDVAPYMQASSEPVEAQDTRGRGDTGRTQEQPGTAEATDGSEAQESVVVEAPAGGDGDKPALAAAKGEEPAAPQAPVVEQRTE